ncbi:MAG: FkbM family methyltransferase [Planctomycetes bacterium]|nr:FkbM family methyltransferase [Planctomycetota bacterium]
MSNWINLGNPDLSAVQKRLDDLEVHQRRMFEVNLRTQRRAYCAYACERGRAMGKPVRRLPEFRSQFGEDLLLFDLFGDQTDGFFIEAGAFNGVDYSPTYVFEQIGWHGLLVEPIPQRFEECRVNRPHSRVVHAALGSPGDPEKATLVITADIYGGMLSFVDTGTEHHKRAMAAPLVKTPVTVPQRTLESILGSDHERLDLVVLDVETNELRVLAGFDLTRHKPRVLVVEDASFGRNEPLYKEIQRHGYGLGGWAGENAIYIHQDEQTLWKRWVDMTRV